MMTAFCAAPSGASEVTFLKNAMSPL
jgi:hypothetical protein